MANPTFYSQLEDYVLALKAYIVAATGETQHRIVNAAPDTAKRKLKEREERLYPTAGRTLQVDKYISFYFPYSLPGSADYRTSVMQEMWGSVAQATRQHGWPMREDIKIQIEVWGGPGQDGHAYMFEKRMLLKNYLKRHQRLPVQFRGIVTQDPAHPERTPFDVQCFYPMLIEEVTDNSDVEKQFEQGPLYRTTFTLTLLASFYNLPDAPEIVHRWREIICEFEERTSPDFEYWVITTSTTSTSSSTTTSNTSTISSSSTSSTLSTMSTVSSLSSTSSSSSSSSSSTTQTFTGTTTSMSSTSSLSSLSSTSSTVSTMSTITTSSSTTSTISSSTTFSSTLSTLSSSSTLSSTSSTVSTMSTWTSTLSSTTSTSTMTTTVSSTSSTLSSTSSTLSTLSTLSTTSSTLSTLSTLSSSSSSSSTTTALSGVYLYYVGNAGAAAGWNTDSYWSLNSGAVGDGHVPTVLDIVVFDGASPSCTMDVNGVGYSMLMTTYGQTVDMNGFNLTIEGVCTCTAGTILGKTGTWIINNSIGGSSTINGLTFTRGTSTIYVRCATAFDFGIRNTSVKSIYNLIVTDPVVSCGFSGSIGNEDQGPNFLRTLTINGGTVSGLVTDLYASTAAKPFTFVAGSDFTGSNTIGFGGSQTLDPLNGPTMSWTIYNYASNKNYTMSGPIKVSAVVSSSAPNFITQGYNFTVAGGLAAKFNTTSGIGGSSTITATNISNIGVNVNNGTETWILNNGASATSLPSINMSNFTVSLGSTGEIQASSNSTIGTWTLNPGNHINFKATKILTVTNLIANGALGNLIYMYSNTAGSSFNLNVAQLNPAVSYVSFKDCNATGSTHQPIVDTNGANVSGNSGITFV